MLRHDRLEVGFLQLGDDLSLPHLVLEIGVQSHQAAGDPRAHLDLGPHLCFHRAHRQHGRGELPP